MRTNPASLLQGVLTNTPCVRTMFVEKARLARIDTVHPLRAIYIQMLHLSSWIPSFRTGLSGSCAMQVSNYAISVGLEGDELSDFTDAQYEALEDLITQLKETQSNVWSCY